MMLRPYQTRMLADIDAAWHDVRRVLGVAPTGSGKTEVAAAIIQRDATPTSRALIVTERKTICHQWVQRLRRHGVDHVGVLQANNTRAVYQPVLVATVQTIRSRQQFPADVGLVVIDESHVWHRSHDDVLANIGNARMLGLTATPLRAGMGLRFDRVVVGATIGDLIAGGYLVRPRTFAPNAAAIAELLEGVHVRAGDYAINELSAAMRGRAVVGDIVGTWLRLGEDRQTICFAVDKAHATDLCSEFMAAGIAAAVAVDETDDDERERLFAAFNDTTIRVLVSVGVLALGFDSPIASCVILARPTLSLSLHVQQGGRVLRPAPGKTDALVLDHAANTMRHGLLEEFDPPRDLSAIDRHSDRKRRDEAPQAWVCRGCAALNALADDVCAGCGMPRRRINTVLVVDGELVPVRSETPPEGVTLADVRQAYLMHRWYGVSKGMRHPAGWAYHATVRRFKLSEPAAKQALPWSLREELPVPPDAECSRWLRADYIRQRYAERAKEHAHA